MGDRAARTADMLEPLYLAMKKRLLESRYIRTDDTPVPVQDDTRDETREARLWSTSATATIPQTSSTTRPTAGKGSRSSSSADSR